MGKNLIDRFQAEYQEYHGLSVARRQDQTRALNRLSTFVSKDLTKCEPEDLRGWYRSLRGEGLKPTTIQKYKKMVLAFFGWAFEVKLITGDELMRLRAVKGPNLKKATPRPYSAEEIADFWGQLAKAYPLDEDLKWLKRFRAAKSHFRRIESHANRLQLTAIARIALDCGLRRQEIYDLSLNDAHYDNAYLVVRHGKGDKFREVPYTSAARAAMKDWIELRTLLNPKHDRPWLALTRLGPGPGSVWLEPMGYRRFQSYLTAVGSWEFHRMRHTCATNWLRVGMPIEILSRFLGHSSIKQTMVYTELTRDDIQRQVERLDKRFAAIA
jgi:integrase